jgi:hypothetical protein
MIPSISRRGCSRQASRMCLAQTTWDVIFSRESVRLQAGDVSGGLRTGMMELLTWRSPGNEQVNAKMPVSVNAKAFVDMTFQKQLPPCVIVGPVAMDAAVSKKAAEHLFEVLYRKTRNSAIPKYNYIILLTACSYCISITQKISVEF